MAVSVKVPRVKLIAALETRLATEKAKTDRFGRTADNDENAKALNAWGKAVAKLIVKDTVVRSAYAGSPFIQFDTTGLDLPAFPEIKPVEYQDAQVIRELDNTIKILGLSEEEFVNASTYRTVLQYI